MRTNPFARQPRTEHFAADSPHVLIVGAGFAGFHCARELERRLGPGEARVTMASPTDYMLYSPLLPHVAAGVLTPPDVAVSLRRSLRRTLRAPCSIVGVDLITGNVDAVAATAAFNAFNPSVSNGQFASLAAGASATLPISVNVSLQTATPALGWMVVSLDNPNGAAQAALITVGKLPTH